MGKSELTVKIKVRMPQGQQWPWLWQNSMLGIKMINDSKTIVENLSQKDSNEKLASYALRQFAEGCCAAASVQLGYSAEVTGQPLLEAVPIF